jgi:hypothetical protein
MSKESESPLPGGPSAADPAPYQPKSTTSVSSGTVTTTTLPPDLQTLLRRLESDPTVVKQNIIEEAQHPIAVTVAELRLAINANPTHIKAQEFSQGIAGLPGARTVYIEQPDLQALIHNRQVVTRITTFNGVSRKVKTVE